jgi:hypothetical protein
MHRVSADKKHSISTSDFKSHPETSGGGKLFDHFHVSHVSHRFPISGKQVPAQTTEPGLHLKSKNRKDVCMNEKNFI